MHLKQVEEQSPKSLEKNEIIKIRTKVNKTQHTIEKNPYEFKIRVFKRINKIKLSIIIGKKRRFKQEIRQL